MLYTAARSNRYSKSAQNCKQQSVLTQDVCVLALDTQARIVHSLGKPLDIQKGQIPCSDSDLPSYCAAYTVLSPNVVYTTMQHWCSAAS